MIGLLGKIEGSVYCVERFWLNGIRAETVCGRTLGNVRVVNGTVRKLH